jgi:metal-sulfur cluster biosynthetic enzyme
MSRQSGVITEEMVRDALRHVDDPEIGMNIVDLGLVYGVDVTPTRLHVDLTMTSPACPMGEMILEDAQHALESLVPAGVAIDLNLVWDPPWSPDRMSADARAHFGWH